MTGVRLDAATRELLTGSLREVLGSPSGAGGLGAALSGLGWDEVLADDPATATSLLFTEHGRALAASRALDDVVLAELAPALSSPARTRAVLYPHPEDVDRPSARTGPLRGVLLGPLHQVDEVVIPVLDAPAGSVALLTVPASEIASVVAPVRGFDRETGWSVVTSAERPAGPPPTLAGAVWERAVAAARRALAAEIIGVCEAALELASRHTADRVQYGRPIASFQAVRHRLAESAVAVAGARSVLEAAWSASACGEAGTWAAALAKLQAGRAQAEVMRHGVQVCGAMGLSLEGDMHRCVTRAAALDVLLGGHIALADSMGRALLAGARLDPVVDF
ncbi:MAG: putative Acyl-CoA dehydrogenase, short-chain specific [Streptosporangiaceae bacterium]|nr:putative Acyl-CoA dehydrogenase, short-chain specific [Streptosporangiaceae bacterium]